MPLMYIPPSHSESPFSSACYSDRYPYSQPYAQPRDGGCDFSYAALVNRQREHVLQRQRREEARLQRVRQREFRLKQERERLIREMIQQREMQRCRQHHNQHQQQSYHRTHPAFHSTYSAEPKLSPRPTPMSIPIHTQPPIEKFLSDMSGTSHREELDNDSASTDEDASEEEFDDSEEELDEQSDTSLAPQLRSELQLQPQPQSSQSLNQIMELEQTLQSLLTEKLPTFNRLQLEGHLTNLLLEADRVDPHGEFDEDAVREKRRELVRAVERVLGGDEDAKENANLDAEERKAEEEVEEKELESELQPLII